ncbi:MAG: sugar phosphate nucleotidyltransferase [Nitrososphaerales archaeon]
MQAVILAGGLGTRLRPLTNNLPKPMVPVNGKPFLEYELNLLKKNGIVDFVLSVSYLANVIVDYFGDGRKMGVSIKYSFDGESQLGAAGAIKKAEPYLKDIFFVTYGDAYLRADYKKAMDEFHKAKKLGMMFVYENHNQYGNSDLRVKDGYVIDYNKKAKPPGMNWINFGVSILRKEALQFIQTGQICGEEEFYSELIKRKELLAFETRERFYEIGTRETLAEFEEWIASSASSVR